MNTNTETAIRLYMFEGETYCKMIDVLRMIHHEQSETDNDSIRAVLSRMKFRLTRNDILNPNNGGRNDNTRIPGRYVVGYRSGIGYRYYAGQDKDQTLFTNDWTGAKLYVTFRDASAAADFIDTHECCVLDMFDFMNEGDRFRRALYVPYNADEGNAMAIQPDIIP